MKKTSSLLLAIILLFSFAMILTSCDDSDAITCPSCGEENSDSVNFCFNCGKPLKKDADTTAPSQEPIDILKNYLKENESIYANQRTSASSQRYDFFKIEYDEKLDDIVFYCFELSNPDLEKLNQGIFFVDDICRQTIIYLDYSSNISEVEWYWVITDSTIYSANAYLDKTTYSSINNTLKDIDINGLKNYSHYNTTVDYFKDDVSSLILYIQDLLNDTAIEVNLNELGFKNY